MLAFIDRVQLCQSPDMYAIDEYYDELDETSTPSVDNVHACILNEE